MSQVDHLSFRTGIASISWNDAQGAASELPKKSIHPLGSARPSYIERIFKVQHSDARIAEALAFKVTHERILTPGNYQDILQQLRDLAAGTPDHDARRDVSVRASCLLDELAGNVNLLNLNRQIQTSS